jgi:hypothetical protein
MYLMLIIDTFVQNCQGNPGGISSRVAGVCLLVLKGLLLGTPSFSSGLLLLPDHPA